MKVKELVELLQKQDQDANVLMSDFYECWYYDVEFVTTARIFEGRKAHPDNQNAELCVVMKP